MTEGIVTTTAEEAEANAARRRKALRQRTALFGVLLVAIVVAVVGLVIRAFTTGGSFISVTALVSRVGDALEDGDEVRYHDLIVGKVVGTGQLVGNQTRLQLDIDTSQAPLIPDGVTARPLPTTLFGSQYVQLLPPAQPGSGHLVAGATIPADTSPGTTALQTALAEVDSLLAAVHPAALDVALTNIAAALNGQGENLGRLITDLDTYLQEMNPSTPALQDDVARLADLSQELSVDAPDNLRTIANLSTTAQTLTARQGQLRDLLSGGITLADDLTPFLNENGSKVIRVSHDLQGVLAAFDRNTPGLANGIVSLGNVAKIWSTFIGPTHDIRIDFLLQHLDVGAAVVASLGGPTGRPAADQAFAAMLNPPTYSAADCPRYPGMAGPNCASASPADTSTPAATPGGNVGPVGSPAEQRAVQLLLGQITGVPPAQVPGFTDIYVGPVLRGTTVLVP